LRARSEIEIGITCHNSKIITSSDAFALDCCSMLFMIEINLSL